MTSSVERAAGSRSRTTRTSRRTASNIVSVPLPGVEGGRAEGPCHDLRGVLAIVRQAVEGALDLGRLEVDEGVQAAGGSQLAGHAGGGDGRAAAIGLEADLGHPAVSHAKKES